MTGQFILGQYQSLDSFGHRLDPRSKIYVSLLLMVLALFTVSSMFYLAVIALIFGLLFSSRIGFGTILVNLKPFIYLVLLTAMYHLLFSARETPAVFDILGISITSGGLAMAASFSLRVMLFITIAFFISLTTAPVDLAEALSSWLKPFRRFGLPVSDIALIIFIAMRFIPVLAEEFDTIRKAQINRGVSFTGGVIKRSRNMIALLIPIFQSALRRADDLALAIESRGYVGGIERSSYRRLKFETIDYLFIGTNFALIIILFLWLG